MALTNEGICENSMDSTDSTPNVPYSSNAEQNKDDTEPSTYYFESDHVALKGNGDYHNLLKTILLLEAQRIQAIKDLDVLIEKEKEALEDPISFVSRLQHQEDLGLPGRQNVPEIPDVQWERYTSNLDPLSWKQKHATRHKQTAPVEVKSSKSADEDSDDEKVRGRAPLCTDKSSTFNKLWTAEEQKKLEDLLLKHPPEAVEIRRWEKIAKSLGNRTVQQVQSRTQKYFIKLAKLKLPIPGRMPHVGGGGKKQHRHHRHHRFYFQPSTFLTSYEPPVYMSDDEGGGNHSDYANGSHRYDYGDISDEEDIPRELRQTEEYRQILELKKLKRRKLKQECEPQHHVGYKCDRCECEPITGTRWHCSDCPQEAAVDFCDDCVDFEFQNEHHNASHKLQPVQLGEKIKTDTQDMDYSYRNFMPGGYNYLDPNYMPAS